MNSEDSYTLLKEKKSLCPLSIYIYIERERERETDRQTDRQTQRQSHGEMKYGQLIYPLPDTN